MAIKPSLEYCSLHFAEYWFGTEKAITNKLKSPDRNLRLEALANGASYFRVARTLPRAADVNLGKPRYGPLLCILEHADHQWREGQKMTSLVDRVRKAIGCEYGGSPLSAASKFLWLFNKDPFVIFDSRARRQLGTAEGKYEDFVAKWEKSYSSLRGSIRRASCNLSTMRLYISAGHSLTDNEVAETVHQEWFARRIHDIYLWEAGDEGKTGWRNSLSGGNRFPGDDEP